MRYLRLSATGDYDLSRFQEWNGSAWVAAVTLPEWGDVVNANGFTCNFIMDAIAAQWRTDAPINGGSAGGGFVYTVGGIEITGDRIAGTTTCFSTALTTMVYAVGNSTGGAINAQGTLTSGTGGIYVVGTGYGGGPLGAHGILNTGSGNTYVTNGCVGGLGVGNPAGSIQPAGYAWNGSGNGYISGQVIGISSNGGTGGVTPGSAATGTVYVEEAYVGIGHNFRAVNGNNNARVQVSRFVNDVDYQLPTATPTFVTLAEVGPVDVRLTYTRFNSPVETSTLLSAVVAPQASDLRLGVTVGAVTGTCAVPPAASVALNVPIDNTIGTYELTVDNSAIAAAVSASLETSLPSLLAPPLATDLLAEISTSSDPLAERLRNASTVQSTGAQLQSLVIAP